MPSACIGLESSRWNPVTKCFSQSLLSSQPKRSPANSIDCWLPTLMRNLFGICFFMIQGLLNLKWRKSSDWNSETESRDWIREQETLVRNFKRFLSLTSAVRLEAIHFGSLLSIQRKRSLNRKLHNLKFKLRNSMEHSDDALVLD